MIKNRIFALIFRLGSLIVVVFGLLAHIGAFDGGIKMRGFMYYTVQSNILAVALFTFLLIRTAVGLGKEGIKGSAGYFSRFEMVCVIDLQLTFWVYWFMLVPTVVKGSLGPSMWDFNNLAVHGIAPMLCLVDYFLFSQARHLKYMDVYRTLLYPLFYITFVTIAGNLGYVYYKDHDGLAVRFPYFFLDYDRTGKAVLYYIAALLIVFLIVGHGYYLVDRLRRKKSKDGE